MKRITAIIVLVLSWGMACSGSPHLHWGGEIALDLAGDSPRITLESTLTVGWQGIGWDTSLAAAVTENEWSDLRWDGTALFGEMELIAGIAFDPTETAFDSAQMEVAFPWSGLQIDVLTRLEENGVGFGFSIAAPRDSIVQRVNLRFNLKQYRAEIVEATFSPKFSHSSIVFKLPLPSENYILAEIDLDESGLDELWLQLQPPLEVFPWLSFGIAMTFSMDEKTVSLSPSLALASPACFDLYWGLDWDSDNNSLNGLKLYGIGFHGEVNGVRLRGLWSLAPDEIALVKAPYWALIGFAWEIEACCGERGGGSVGLFFGKEQLFSLEEVEAALKIPVGEGFTVQATLQIKLDGGQTLRLGWELEW